MECRFDGMKVEDWIVLNYELYVLHLASTVLHSSNVVVAFDRFPDSDAI